MYFCLLNCPELHFLLYILVLSVTLSHTRLAMLSINCLHNTNMVKLRSGPKKACSQADHKWNVKQVCLKKSEWRGECNRALKCQPLEKINIWLCYTAGVLTLQWNFFFTVLTKCMCLQLEKKGLAVSDLPCQGNTSGRGFLNLTVAAELNVKIRKWTFLSISILQIYWDFQKSWLFPLKYDFAKTRTIKAGRILFQCNKNSVSCL